VCHNRKLGQGYVSINMRLSLADMDENQVIKLRVCPEMVHMCSVKSACDGSIPDQVVSMLRAVKEASEVSAFKLHPQYTWYCSQSIKPVDYTSS
jgi:hypothetical protein